MATSSEGHGRRSRWQPSSPCAPSEIPAHGTVSLDAEHTQVCSRLRLEAYAAALSRARRLRRSGRVVEAIDESWASSDNTLVIYIHGRQWRRARKARHQSARSNEIVEPDNGVQPSVEQAIGFMRIDLGGPARHFAPLCGRLGTARGRHAVPVDEAGGVALRRHAQRDDRLLAGAASRITARFATSSTTASTSCRR